MYVSFFVLNYSNVFWDGITQRLMYAVLIPIHSKMEWIYTISLTRRARYSWYANNKIFWKIKKHTRAHTREGRASERTVAKKLDTIGLTLSTHVCNSCMYATYWYIRQRRTGNELLEANATDILLTYSWHSYAIVKQQKSIDVALEQYKIRASHRFSVRKQCYW